MPWTFMRATLCTFLERRRSEFIVDYEGVRVNVFLCESEGVERLNVEKKKNGS